jgi:hypothetical protein
MSVAIVPASPAHVGRIASRMRAIDRLECQAMGHGPKEALRAGLMNSSLCFTATVDGKAEAMFGLVVNNALCGHGTPWFLGSDSVFDHPREMLTYGPLVVDLFCEQTPSLSNYVAAQNDRAIRLLRRWGFSISDEALSFGGVEFRQFSR